MILGALELEKKLRALSEMDLRQGIEKGISLVQEDAKANCPVYDGELRESIFTEVENKDAKIRGTCYTNKRYAPYVEFGTGPRGQADHDGISPDVPVAYTQTPWWIHESQIGRDIAEHYGFFYIDTDEGRFYKCYGQAAQPFMYPALKNNEEEILKIIKRTLKEQL
jgi:HK97 gp10 family phage protein